MAEDRGGLNYPIRIGDEFSASLLAFQRQLSAAKDELGLLKAAAAGGISLGIESSTSQLSKVRGELQKLRDSNLELKKALKERSQASDAAAASLDPSRDRAAATAARDRAAAERDLTEALQEQVSLSGKAGEQLSLPGQVAKAVETEAEARKRNAAAMREERAQEKERIASAKESEAIIKRANAGIASRSKRGILDGVRDSDPGRTSSAFTAEIQASAEDQRRTKAAATALGRQQRAQEASDAKQRREELRALNASLDQTEGSAQKANSAIGLFFSSVGRRVASFAFITIARDIIRAFKDIVQGALEFNAKIETSNIEIGALLASVGEVSDGQGKLVTGAEAFNRSQTVARKLVQGLKQDALQAGVAFEPLLETFKQAVGPGLANGFNVDQIRAFALQVTKAGAALALSGEQLGVEIRGILSGQFEKRTNKIASAIGISKEDLQQARQAGTEFEFLEKRFGAFNEAGKLSLNTFDGLFARVRDSIDQLIAAGGLGFFEQVKVLLQDIFNLTTAKTKDGLLTPNPAAVAVIQRIADVLRDAAKKADDLVKSLSSGGLQGFAEGLGTASDAASFFLDIITLLARGIEASFKLIKIVVTNLPALFKESFTSSTKAAKAFDAEIEATFSDFEKRNDETFSRIKSKFDGSIPGTLEQIIIPIKPEIVDGGKDLGLDTTTISQSTAPLEKQLELVKQIKEETQKTRAEFEANRQTLGLEGAIVEQRKISLQTTVQLEKDLLDLHGQQKAALADLARIQKAGAAERTAALLQAETENVSFEVIRQRIAKTRVDETIAQRTVNELSAEILAIERARRVEASLRIEQIAIRETEALRKQTQELQLQNAVRAQALATAAGQPGASAFGAQVSAAQGQVELESKKLDIQRQQQAFEKSSLEFQITQASSLTEQVALRDQLLGLGASATAKDTEQAQKIAAANLEVQKLADPATAFRTQIQGAFAEFDKPLAITGVQTAVKAIGALVEGLASTVSSLIVDAFDPTKKVDVVQRFAQLFQQISQLIIQELIKIAITKALIQTGLTAAGGLATGGEVVSQAEGGPIPNSGRPSLAHYIGGGRGFRRGGPPRGVDSRDTVPIWTQPGEWVIRLASVRKYGAQVMARINAGLIDPSALAMVAGAGGKSISIRAPSTPSFAGGGAIADRFADVVAPGKSSAQTATPASILVMDKDNAERFYAASHTAHMRWAKENKAELRSVLGVQGQR